MPVISLVVLPRGDAKTTPGGIRQHRNASLEAGSRYSHSVIPVLPFHHSNYAQFSASPRTACRRMTRRRVLSASGTKDETVSKTHFELKALSFGKDMLNLFLDAVRCEERNAARAAGKRGRRETERSVGKSERSVCIFGIVPNPCQLCGGCRKLQIDYLQIVLIHA